MSYLLVGLGNPGDEYANTRHNAGRMMLEYFRTKHDFPDWKHDKSLNALVSKGSMQRVTLGESPRVTLCMPETFMNLSGGSVAPLVKSAKAAEKLVVVYDDIDLPLGSFKIAFNRGSGGHKGIESIAKALKTEAFVRVRVGIVPILASGKLKKPKGAEAVHKFIVGQFQKGELETIKKLSKEVVEALEVIIKEGHLAAMGKFN